MSTPYLHPIGHAPPSQGYQFSEQTQETIPPQFFRNLPVEQMTRSIKDRVRLFITEDNNLSRLVLRLFSIASNALNLVGRGISSIPILNIAATPFFLNQNIQIARFRLSVMGDSIRLSKFTSFFTWGGTGIAYIGDAISNISGALMSFSHSLPSWLLTFIPTFLIVAGSFGMLSEPIAMRRTAQALKKFNAEKQNIGSILHSLEGSDSTNRASQAVQQIYDSFKERLADNEQASVLLEDLKQLTEKLMNPEKGTELELIDEARSLVKALKAFAQGEHEAIDQTYDALTQIKLDEAEFQDHHFTEDTRRIDLQNKVTALLESSELKTVSDKVKKIFDTLKDNLPSIDTITRSEHPTESTKIMAEVQNLSIKTLSEFELIDRVLPLYEKLKNLHEKVKNEKGVVGEWVQQSIGEIDQHYKELSSLKTQATKIIDTAQSEMHRRLFIHAMFALLYTLGFIAGVLMVLPSPHLRLAFKLSIVLASIDAAFILFEKNVSQENFLKIETKIAAVPKLLFNKV